MSTTPVEYPKMRSTEVRNRYAVLIVCFCAFAARVGCALVLDVPERFQEESQWCWAGVSQAIFDYYAISLTQTEIAQYGTEGVNTWNWLYGSSSNPTRRGINMILNHWGISEDHGEYLLTKAEIEDEIHASQPFVIRWAWDTGGGHFVVGHGIEGNDVYTMDPWPGNGYCVNAYEWVTNGSSHTWTHTLTTINTTPYVDITNGASVFLRVGETNCVIGGTNNIHVAGIWWSNITTSVGNLVNRDSGTTWTAVITPLAAEVNVVRVYGTNGWSIVKDEILITVPEPYIFGLSVMGCGVLFLRGRKTSRCYEHCA